MKVLELIGSFHQGGSERQAVQLARLLRANGVAVAVAALDGAGVLRAELERAGFDAIPEFPLKSFYDANFVRQLMRAARFLRDERIEVVHTHDFYTNVFGMLAAQIAGTPRAVASKRETGGMRTKMQRRVEKFAFRQANAIVANSAAVKEYLLAEGVAGAKIRVVYNGLDLARAAPGEPVDEREVRARFGLPADERARFVTMVANLRHEVKNHPMLLRAARRVIEKFPHAHFVLAGEGDLRAGLEAQAAALGIEKNTHFTGRCDAVPELLAISFAGVLTSFNEGFSNSILEYMAARLPVVATDVGGAREAVEDGASGYLVASDDEAALAARLAELLAAEAKARAFGARGRALVEEKFSTAAQLANTLKIYGL